MENINEEENLPEGVSKTLRAVRVVTDIEFKADGVFLGYATLLVKDDGRVSLLGDYTHWERKEIE